VEAIELLIHVFPADAQPATATLGSGVELLRGRYQTFASVPVSLLIAVPGSSGRANVPSCSG